MTCFIIDDQDHCITLLEYYISRIPGLELIGSESRSSAAVEKLLKPERKPDITFLDIEMPGVNGLEIAQIIQRDTQIIFTTGMRGFGPEAFEIGATDYLLKPFSLNRFEDAISKAFTKAEGRKNLLSSREDKSLFIPGNGKNEAIRINLEDVSFIKAAANYSDIQMTTGAIHCTYFGLGELENFLPSGSFYRVHKSYIVNMDHIKSVSNDIIFMEDKAEIPISDTYKKPFWDQIAIWRKNKT